MHTPWQSFPMGGMGWTWGCEVHELDWTFHPEHTISSKSGDQVHSSNTYLHLSALASASWSECSTSASHTTDAW